MALQEVPKKLADCFWGNDDEGFQVLMERMKVAKHSTAELQVVLQQRADLEEEYAKKLLKLTKSQGLASGEDGTLKDALEAFRSQLETHAKSRIIFAEDIRSKIDKPMNAFNNQQRDSRKIHQNAVEKSQKAKQNQIQNVIKAEEKYYSKCAELDMLSNTRNSQKNPKELEKLDKKIQSTQQASKQADAEYQSAVEKLREVHTAWMKDMYAACEEFQKLEESRIDYVRNALWTYANANSTLCISEDETNETLRKVLEKCDVESDIQLFIKKKGTGDMIPAPLEYRNFYTQDLNDKRTSKDKDQAPKSPTRTLDPSSLREPNFSTASKQSTIRGRHATADNVPQRKPADSIPRAATNADSLQRASVLPSNKGNNPFFEPPAAAAAANSSTQNSSFQSQTLFANFESQHANNNPFTDDWPTTGTTNSAAGNNFSILQPSPGPATTQSLYPVLQPSPVAVTNNPFFDDAPKAAPAPTTTAAATSNNPFFD